MVKCAFVHCTNSRNKSPGVSFFKIPKLKDTQCTKTRDLLERRQARWLSVINNVEISRISSSMNVDNLFVCSVHFVTGKPAYEMHEFDVDWAPSLHTSASPKPWILEYWPKQSATTAAPYCDEKRANIGMARAKRRRARSTQICTPAPKAPERALLNSKRTKSGRLRISPTRFGDMIYSSTHTSKAKKKPSSPSQEKLIDEQDEVPVKILVKNEPLEEDPLAVECIYVKEEPMEVSQDPPEPTVLSFIPVESSLARHYADLVPSAAESDMVVISISQGVTTVPPTIIQAPQEVNLQSEAQSIVPSLLINMPQNTNNCPPPHEQDALEAPCSITVFDVPDDSSCLTPIQTVTQPVASTSSPSENTPQDPVARVVSPNPSPTPSKRTVVVLPEDPLPRHFWQLECSVPGCGKARKDQVTLHPLPSKGVGPVRVKDHTGTRVEDCRTMWLALLGIKDFKKHKDIQVCSAHFDPHDFKSESDLLRDDAVPSRNLPTLYFDYEVLPLNDPESDSSAETTSQEVPMSELCRLCGRAGPAMTDIFGEEAAETKLLDKIQQCVPIKVEKEPDLPDQVCSDCISKLNTAYKLAKTARLCDVMLRARLATKRAFEMQPRPRVRLQNADRALDSEDLATASPEHLDERDDSIETFEESSQRSDHTYSSRRTPPPSLSPPPLPPPPPPDLTNMFICPKPHCQAPLASKVLLRRHLWFSHSVHDCNFCNMQFNSLEALSTHKDKLHPKICVYCKKQLTKIELTNHMRSHNALPRFVLTKAMHESRHTRCQLCSSILGSDYAAKKHYFKEHLLYSCELCLELFQRCEEDVRHAEEVHAIPCPYCPHKSYSPRRLRRHVNQKHKVQSAVVNSPPKSHDQMYECSDCKKGVSSKLFLMRHYYWSHNKFACVICLEKFESAETQARHFAASHENVCVCCEEVQGGAEALRVHMENHHPGHGTYTCEYCGEHFHEAGLLVEHRNCHVVPKSYLCDQCGKGFTTCGLLGAHKVKHRTKEQREKVGCPVCEKRFQFESHLRAHMLKHTGERHFQCRDCELGFTTGTALFAHIKAQHAAAAKTLHCDHCGMGFVTRRGVQEHVAELHTEVFRCSACTKSFTSRADVELHVSFHPPGTAAYRPIPVFTCHKCRRPFSSKPLLHKHVVSNLRRRKCKT